MTVGSLVAVMGDRKKFLYTAAPIHRADMCGHVEAGDLCVVLDSQEHPTNICFFVKIFCHRGIGWINASYLKELTRHDCT